MSTPFIGEIRMFGFGRVPEGWFTCNGSLVPIAAYETLFTVIGTTYGGDGVNTFALPDLRGRLPLHQGQGPGLTNRVIGESSGTESVTLSVAQMPAHTHTLFVTSATASLDTPTTTALPAAVSGETFYVTDVGTGATAVAMETAAVSSSGGNQPHENCMPTLTVQYCMAWTGIYPSRP